MGELKIITMRDVTAEPVEFLWKPYIPLGKITILQGDAMAAPASPRLPNHIPACIVRSLKSSWT